MKKNVMLIATVAFIATIFATNSVIGKIAELTGPLFVWEATTHNFGKIEKGTPVNHLFNFTNKGDVPLVISSVKASCGCTVANYTKTPIPVGGKGFVSARYNAAKAGTFSKTVTVMANTGIEAIVLTLKGEVSTE
ncbi:MAG: DUF1573 domain-containing protein [Cyclobacteriaceae bacterium]|nr:DUF1573 domain-containing protein [Cyclobacteriaceae bacterium]